jgi:hypothetical protein
MTPAEAQEHLSRVNLMILEIGRNLERDEAPQAEYLELFRDWLAALAVQLGNELAKP